MTVSFTGNIGNIGTSISNKLDSVKSTVFGKTVAIGGKFSNLADQIKNLLSNQRCASSKSVPSNTKISASKYNAVFAKNFEAIGEVFSGRLNGKPLEQDGNVAGVKKNMDGAFRESPSQKKLEDFMTKLGNTPLRPDQICAEDTVFLASVIKGVLKGSDFLPGAAKLGSFEEGNDALNFFKNEFAAGDKISKHDKSSATLALKLVALSYQKAPESTEGNQFNKNSVLVGVTIYSADDINALESAKEKAKFVLENFPLKGLPQTQSADTTWRVHRTKYENEPLRPAPPAGGHRGIQKAAAAA